MTREPTINEYAEALGALAMIHNLLPYSTTEHVQEVVAWFDETMRNAGHDDPSLLRTARTLVSRTATLGGPYPDHAVTNALGRHLLSRIGYVRAEACKAFRAIMEEA